ncbi:MAG: hypothetical protein HUU20_24715 [Pirellulales bacterium]|nr:hypothetical protein [Pirellulales bacterium]
MTEPSITIHFDSNGRAFHPGETISGEYCFDSFPSEEVKAVEVSILWYTDGKGDTDMAVHDFRRIASDEGEWIDPRRPGSFRTVLPNSPLSYDGAILKLNWCVRVRAFLGRGKEVVGELPFRLGAVAPAQATAP